MVFYNEIEPFAVRWLRNLEHAKIIAPGLVDDRSITAAAASPLSAFTQCHFFAGIGIWSYALRLAGWPDDEPVWTGSCPCQPFSSAGRRGGFDDARHLWPAWFDRIRICHPPIIFGEQVANGDGLAWLDAVSSDLESEGYAVGAADLCAAGVGAPHIRQRLYFVAVGHTDNARLERRRLRFRTQPRQGEVGAPVPIGGLADNNRERFEGIGVQLRQRRSLAPVSQIGGRSPIGALAEHAGGGRIERILAQRLASEGEDGARFIDGERLDGPGPVNGFWRNADWIWHRDGKWRPVESGAFPLANGATARVGRLRAYGNAIVGPLAAQFIQAVMDIL